MFALTSVQNHFFQTVDLHHPHMKTKFLQLAYFSAWFCRSGMFMIDDSSRIGHYTPPDKLPGGFIDEMMQF
jgi:hypothetical protein